ncbi:hypothetical protein [Chryseobacterium paludis]|uniref:hypothetical protein n=1 Tax=Chryseobacterium paludis TaxID=2956784 RepID=UPI0021C0FDCB|nr:hypothetical protein [Chryseobacterium paludis]
MIALITWMNSCSSEGDLLNNKEEKYSKKFQVFTSKNGEAVNYSAGFKKLLENYDGINNTGLSKEGFFSQKRVNKLNDEYVEFNVHSQDIILENGDHWIIYPIIKNNSVSGLTIAVLKDKETFVEYLPMDSNSNYYLKIIDLFKLQYEKSTRKARASNKGGNDCGFDLNNPCDIDEVIINIPNPGNGSNSGGGAGGPGGGGPGGGCSKFQNCIDPNSGGGGGGEGSYENPCDKAKERLVNPKIQAKINELKNQSTQGGEKGVMFKADGTPSPTISGGAHSVNFGDKTGYQGGYHNHTPTGIPMLSPPDIDQLLQFALAQGNGNPTNASNAYLGMVAPNGMHYVILFNGTYNDALVTFSQQDLDDHVTRYQTRYGMFKPSTSEGYEKLFFKSLNDMGLNGKVTLQRIESDGTIKTVTKNDNGTTTAIPCL